MNSTVYNVDGSPSSPLLSCKASKTWALKGEAGKKQPGLNRKGGRGGGEKKEKNSTLKRCFEGWEVAPTLPEDQDLILNTHIAAHSYPRGYKTLFWSPREPGMHMVHRHTCRQKSHIHNNLIKKKKDFEPGIVAQNWYKQILSSRPIFSFFPFATESILVWLA